MATKTKATRVTRRHGDGRAARRWVGALVALTMAIAIGGAIAPAVGSVGTAPQPVSPAPVSTVTGAHLVSAGS